ncbi:MAG: class IV adenylate cyclase [Gemmatimonadetes bacterium]|nr:class IV adenylate cyclase [Gemmatimonadota bacterium]
MPATQEVELKAMVDDVARRRRAIEAAGARLTFEGALVDVRWDSPARDLTLRDHVLRLRTYRSAAGVRAMLDWKGPTRYEGGFKVREELTTSLGSPEALAAMLEKLGYIVTREIERTIAQYELAGCTVRFEEYPRMDPLVEVEGTPDAIEAAIAALGLPRAAFTTERLPDFVMRFQARTGTFAALCARELAGEHPWRVEDA